MLFETGLFESILFFESQKNYAIASNQELHHNRPHQMQHQTEYPWNFIVTGIPQFILHDKIICLQLGIVFPSKIEYPTVEHDKMK